jgi:hypothetical protein
VNRRAFVAALGAMLAAPLAVAAEQAGKVYRVGLLSTAGLRPSPSGTILGIVRPRAA